MAHAHCMLDKQCCTRLGKSARTPKHKHARPHGRALIHTHTCVILIAFLRQQPFRENASLPPNKYVDSLVCYNGDKK